MLAAYFADILRSCLILIGDRVYSDRAFVET